MSDDIINLAVPSPTRQRVGGADPVDVTEPVDDLDHIYDALPAMSKPASQPLNHPDPAAKSISAFKAIRPSILPGLGTVAHAQDALSEGVNPGPTGSRLETIAQSEASCENTYGSYNFELANCTLEVVEKPQDEMEAGEPVPNSEALILVETVSKPEFDDRHLNPAAEGISGSRQDVGIEKLNELDAVLDPKQIRELETSHDLQEKKPSEPNPLHVSSRLENESTTFFEPTPTDSTTVDSSAEHAFSKIIGPVEISSNKPPNSMSIKEQTFEEIAEENKANAEAEFELDSSPLESSDLDGSESSTSSDSDEDDFTMLDPEEQARRLMGEDGGSDEDVEGKGMKTTGPIRTLNEKTDEIVPKPDMIITDDMKIEELGHVENLVENVVVIKAKTSGEYQVLDSGSVLCLEDKKVVGSVAETLGRVQQPFYSVRFTDAAAISEAGISVNTRIFYVDKHSTYIFTQPLKAFKGSDASNIHDEEVGDDELEFSDDEAEAEHRRRLKLQRLSRREGREVDADGFTRGPQGIRGKGRGRKHRGVPHPRVQGLPSMPERPPGTELALNYDDGDGMDLEERPDTDELYTPLARPMNLHQMMGMKEAPVNVDMRGSNSNRENSGRGRCMHHRGYDKGRGRSRGRGRGLPNSNRDVTNINPHPRANEFGETTHFPPLPTPQYSPSSQNSHHFGHMSIQQPPQAYPPVSYVPNNHNMYPPTFSHPPQTHTQSLPHQYHSTPQYQNQQQQQQMYPSCSQPSNYQIPPQQPAYLLMPPNIPRGAHINPAFFQQAQSSFTPTWQEGRGYGNNR